MRKAKNLKVIAEKVLQRSLAKRTWHPNTRDLSIQYDLDETQVATVKQYVKKQAADLGVLWGWDPSIKGFRVAPDQDNKVAREMLAFAFDSWANAGKSIRYQVRGRSEEHTSELQSRENLVCRLLLEKQKY